MALQDKIAQRRTALHAEKEQAATQQQAKNLDYAKRLRTELAAKAAQKEYARREDANAARESLQATLQSYAPLLGELQQRQRAQAAKATEAINDRLSDAQRELLPLLAKLPDDFPTDEWDTMLPKKQLALIQKTDLTREEQWVVLNARPSIHTLSQIRELQNNRAAYGLTSAELNTVVSQLQKIGDARINARNRTFYFANDRARNLFLKMMDEEEEKVHAELRRKREEREMLISRMSPAIVSNGTGALFSSVSQRPEATPLPAPSRAYINQNRMQLYKEINKTVKKDLSIPERIKGWNNTKESLEKVFEYEDAIHEMADKYGVPAEYIETIMFREQRFIDFQDTLLADPAVSISARLRNDSSTGIMQVQGKTGVEAVNAAVGSKRTTYEDLGIQTDHPLNPANRDDRMLVWRRMREDDRVCIEVATSNILLCANEQVTEKTGKTFNEFNEEDVIKTLARYNGEGDSARTYGEECYHCFQSFADYERNGAGYAE